MQFLYNLETTVFNRKGAAIVLIGICMLASNDCAQGGFARSASGRMRRLAGYIPPDTLPDQIDFDHTATFVKRPAGEDAPGMSYQDLRSLLRLQPLVSEADALTPGEGRKSTWYLG
ncbi:uncharacterized protein LOC129602821 [Paramacrobiotus metropolitanus]|uniref:uncharacterized protein LOC129602821 n=1 Tax=Paramacrobiotus metropolitanus TaxID=2943436 RepID=UPI002445E885|nr:uncharacterized protein LOC129602821 [Paramacrobiotus metropolitanus]